MIHSRQAFLVAALALGGCAPAQLLFGEGYAKDGLTFYDPSPHLLVTVAADCTISSQVVAIPGKARSVRLKSGYGASELSVGFGNGLITSVGQKTDTKVPETIAAVGSLAASAAALVKGPGAQMAPPAPAASPTPKPKTCIPQASLYPINDGAIDQAHDKLKGFTVTQSP